MTPRPTGPPADRKLLGGAAIKARIALVSALVLGVGAWLTPRAAPQGEKATTIAVPQEHAAPLLEEQVQLREAARTFVGVQDVATRVRGHSVAIVAPATVAPESQNDFSENGTADPRTAGFGVYVADDYVLTHSGALNGRSSVPLSTADGPIDGHVVAYEPRTGLVLLRSAPAERRAATPAGEAPAAGALAVGVGRAEGRDIAVPLFVTEVGGDRYTLGGSTDSVLPGMPVFNLAGELFAIAAAGGREGRAIPVRDAAERLIARASAQERRSSFGLGFQALDGALTRVFGEQGVVVTDVLEGGPADLAGAEVGDVLLAVGDVEVDAAATAGRLLSTAIVGTPTTLRLRRAGRVREVEATPALAYEVAGLARSRREGPAGPDARVVLAAPLRERAAIPPSAQVLSINGRPVTSRAQAQRDMRPGRTPVPVLLRLGEHRFFVAVEPTP